MIASIPKAIQTHSWCLADRGVCTNWFILAWCIFFNLCGRPVFWVRVESSGCQFRFASARSDVSFPSPNHTPLASTPPPKSPWGMHALQWVRQGRDMSLLRGVGWGGANSLSSATQAAWHSWGLQLSISCHKFFTLKVSNLDMTVHRNVTSALVVLSCRTHDLLKSLAILQSRPKSDFNFFRLCLCLQRCVQWTVVLAVCV